MSQELDHFEKPFLSCYIVNLGPLGLVRPNSDSLRGGLPDTCSAGSEEGLWHSKGPGTCKLFSEFTGLNFKL